MTLNKNSCEYCGTEFQRAPLTIVPFDIVIATAGDGNISTGKGKVNKTENTYHPQQTLQQHDINVFNGTASTTDSHISMQHFYNSTLVLY